MNSPLLTACLLFVACAPPPLFETECGIKFEGMTNGSRVPDEWSQSVIQGLEDRALHAFEQVTDPRFATACVRARGWGFYLYPTPTWYEGDRRAAGVTYCDNLPHSFVVGSAEPIKSSFAHELAHVVQNCDPQYLVTGDADHAGWSEQGIYAAINAAR